MLINMVFPLIYAFGMILIRNVIRLIDMASCNKTKCYTQQQYIDTYAGPEFYIHLKYSSILKIIFITMMYGVQLPVLFPIAFMSFMILYVLENFLLYYSYRIPPTYDEKLNESVLNTMINAPLFMCFFGFWQLSSFQLLPYHDKQLIPKETLNSQYVADHYWYQYMNVAFFFKYSGPAIPFSFFFGLYLIMRFIKYNKEQCIWLKTKLLIFKPENEYLEQLNPFFESLDKEDRQWTIMEEQYCSDQLKMN